MSIDAAEQTVFIIDDDEDVRVSLTRSMTKRGFTVEAFATARAFLDQFAPKLSGCLILDYGMPEMNGLELQAELAKMGLSIPIIFITGHGGVPVSVQAMKMGAIDFLEKPFSPEALAERVREAFAIDRAARADREKTARLNQRFSALTAREREIAQFIFANPGAASSKEIARKLDISPRTIDHHRARILEKLQLRSVFELMDFMAALTQSTETTGLN
ncbi:MAG: response regulator [Pseudomonadota bacterium]